MVVHDFAESLCSNLQKLHIVYRKENFDDVVLQKHLQVMEDMIARDKNKPAIVMWSVANEPTSDLPQARAYFK